MSAGQALRDALYAAWPEIRCKCPNDDPHKPWCKVGELVSAVHDAAEALGGGPGPTALMERCCAEYPEVKWSFVPHSDCVAGEPDGVSVTVGWHDPASSALLRVSVGAIATRHGVSTVGEFVAEVKAANAAYQERLERGGAKP